MESSTATKERDESSAMPAEVLHLGKSVKSPGEKLDAPSSRAAKIESIVGQIPQSNAGNVKAIAVQLVREAMRKAGADLSYREGNNDANGSQGDAEAVGNPQQQNSKQSQGAVEAAADPSDIEGQSSETKEIENDRKVFRVNYDDAHYVGHLK